jgi:hypothetical protein
MPVAIVVLAARSAPSLPEPCDSGERDREEEELQPAAAAVGSDAEQALNEVHGAPLVVVARLLVEAIVSLGERAL